MLTFGARRTLPCPGRPAAAGRGRPRPPRAEGDAARAVPVSTGWVGSRSSSTATTRRWLPRWPPAWCRTSRARASGSSAVLRAHHGWWWRVPTSPDETEVGPAPYDDESHPFSVHAVFEGRVTHANREALRDLVAPAPEERRRMEQVVARLPAPAPSDLDRALEVVRRCVQARADPDDDEAALVLRAVTRVEIRDVALERGDPRQRPRAPAGVVQPAAPRPRPAGARVAAVPAFCAWQAGDGALAWCALDRCFAVDDRASAGRLPGRVPDPRRTPVRVGGGGRRRGGGGDLEA